MLNTNEENGIFGYENSKQKKIKKSLLGYDNLEEKLTTPLSDEQRSAMIDDAKIASANIEYEKNLLSAPLDKEKKMEQYNAATRNFLLPSPNDEARRRHIFASSDNVVNDATENLFQNNIKGVFDSERSTSEEKARQEYRKYSSVPGANHMSALGALRRESDPDAVVERTMQQIDGGELDNIAQRYAHYAGMSPLEYRKYVLEPNIRKRLYKEYVDEATPKSSAEFMARSAYNGSLLGKLSDLQLNAYSHTNSQSLIDREGLASYDANRWENLAAGIGSLVLDAPVFSAIGGLSSVAVKGVSGIAKNITSSLVKKYASKGLQATAAERMVEQAIKSRMAAKIAGSAATQGLTLGGYDAGQSVADDLLRNEGIDLDKAVKAYGHGFATGAAVGMVGTPLRSLSQGLTGGKKIAASAGVLGAEAAVFTASSQVEKAAAGVDIEPIDLLADFGESVATLGVMKLTHWRPKGGYAKLNADGHLRKGLEFTKSEQHDMMNAGVEPRLFINELESALNTSSKESSSFAQKIVDKYMQMMSSEELAASTRAKLCYLVQNKITSTPPAPVSYKVDKSPEGNYRFSLIDINGRRISSIENLAGPDVETKIKQTKALLRRNRIAGYEAELLGESLSENYFNQVREFAHEKGVNIEKIVEALYKKANNRTLSPNENAMIDAISQRASYGNSRVGYMLQNIRRNIEHKYNLEEGALLGAIDYSSNSLSSKENRALDEYARKMQNEVNLLRNGVDKQRLLSLDREMAASSFGDLTNYEAKLGERRRYLEKRNAKDEKAMPGQALPGDEMQFPVNVPKQWSGPYAWNVYGIKNTHADIMRLRSHALKLAKLYGYDVKFIYDERAIPMENDNIQGYNNKVRSLGWVDNRGKEIFFNLPNISDIHELERTFAHEVVGHVGISNLMGRYMNELFELIYRKADPELRRDLHNLGEAYGIEGHEAVGEYLAGLAEKNSLTSKENSLLNRFKGFVRNFLVKNKLYSPDNDRITKEDLKTFITSHQKAMFEGKRPDEYRSSVLEKFPSLRELPDYYDDATYRDYMHRTYPDKNKALAETPSFMWSPKKSQLDNLDSDANLEQPTSYRLIGKKGAERLANSEYRSALADVTPENADKLEAEGVNPSEIWTKTRWERGMDAKWRTEITEEEMKLNDPFNEALRKKSSLAFAAYDVINGIPTEERSLKHKNFLKKVYKNHERIFKDKKIELQNLINDPVLFTAYPDIAKVKVEFNDNIKSYCQYDVFDNTFYVNPGSFQDKKTFSKAINREVQKMIQKQENFMRSIDLMRADIEGRYKMEYENAMNLAKIIIRADNNDGENLCEEAIKKFKNVYGVSPYEFRSLYPTSNEYILKLLYDKNYRLAADVEVDNVVKRMEYPAFIRNSISPSQTESVKRDVQVPFVSLKEVEEILSGPIDIIRRALIVDRMKRKGETMEDGIVGFDENSEVVEILKNIDEFREPLMTKDHLFLDRYDRIIPFHKSQLRTEYGGYVYDHRDDAFLDPNAPLEKPNLGDEQLVPPLVPTFYVDSKGRPRTEYNLNDEILKNEHDVLYDKYGEVIPFHKSQLKSEYDMKGTRDYDDDLVIDKDIFMKSPQFEEPEADVPFIRTVPMFDSKGRPYTKVQINEEALNKRKKQKRDSKIDKLIDTIGDDILDYTNDLRDYEEFRDKLDEQLPN